MQWSLSFLMPTAQPEGLYSVIQILFISNGCGEFVVSIMHALRVESWIHNELSMPSRIKSTSCAEVRYRVFLPFSCLQNCFQRQQEGDKSHMCRKTAAHLLHLSYASIVANWLYKTHSSISPNNQFSLPSFSLAKFPNQLPHFFTPCHLIMMTQ